MDVPNRSAVPEPIGSQTMEQPSPVVTAIPRAPQRPAASAEGDYIREQELFRRNLSEVYLLLDFVSERADKSLEELADAVHRDIAGVERKSMSAQEVVEEVCKIAIPQEGSFGPSAPQMALLLMVKDKLNHIAAPAFGRTIAFTSMVAGISLRYDAPAPGLRLWPLFRRAPARGRAPSAPPPPPQASPGQRSRERYFAAKEAYPNLEAQARRFRKVYERLPWLAMAAVCFIMFTNWDIGIASSTLDRIHKEAAVLAPHSATEVCSPGFARTSTQQTICTELSVERANFRGLVSPAIPWRPVPLSIWLADVAYPQVGPDQPFRLEGVTVDAIVAYDSFIIPMAFGLLGTLVGLIRSITVKVHDSLLAPRDLMVVMSSLCLGLSAGLAVGLFFSTNAAGKVEGVGSTININTAGLSFLAGVGAETFFTFLDGILTRLMPNRPPGGRPPIPN
jgi:hypothetical protein